MTELREKVLDTFEDLSGWKAITSGQAALRISQDQGLKGKAMRLDFDFLGGGGFVVAAKAFFLELPESYSFLFHIRGRAPRNAFEFKLVDETHQNVWRYRVEAFDFQETWQPLTIRSHQVGFAWGPLGGGPPRNVAAMELVIAAGPGGSGTVCIDALRFRDETYRSRPLIQVSSALPGHGPENVLTPDGSCWRSEAPHEPQWLLMDFQQEREYGGLVVQWEKGFQPRKFDVQVSLDGTAWNTVYATSQGGSETELPIHPTRRFPDISGSIFAKVCRGRVLPFEGSRSDPTISPGPRTTFFHPSPVKNPLACIRSIFSAGKPTGRLWEPARKGHRP